MLLSISLLTSLSLYSSDAYANPAGTNIPSAISLDIPPQGFSGLAEAVKELTLDTITIEDFYEDNGCGFGDVSYGIENFYMDVEINDVSLIPRQGYLELDGDLLLSINSPTDPFVLTLCSLIQSDCDVDILPSIINIKGNIYMDVVDVDNDEKKEVDVTISDIGYDYSDFNDDKINFNNCIAATINSIFEFFGGSLIDLIIGE